MAQAQAVPLPRPRPADLGKAVPVMPVSPPDRNATGKKERADESKAGEKPDGKPGETMVEKNTADPMSACFTALEAIASIRPLPAISIKDSCEATDVVSLEAIVLADNRSVTLEPAATLRCPMASAVAEWVRGSLAPAALQLGSGLHAIENASSFECRGRNRVAGAKLSEHGKANALDIRGVKLESGTLARLTDPQVDSAFRETVRKTACERFPTVLGPGSDGYHEDHIHLDLIERHNDYRICQWDMRPAEPRAISPTMQ